MTEVIRLESVTKSFDTVVAVDEVSFSVGTGEVVGLLGPNGAGKTTTLRLLAGYYEPDEGVVLVDGLDPTADPVVARRSIGYLPENNPLYDDMFVDEYLRFVSDLKGMSGGERDQAVDRAARETGVDEVLARPIGELSKGFRQRTGLAAAVLSQPPVLILDEPTEGLDPNQRVDIRELIRQIGKKRTVLVSTHVLQEVQNTCDRAVVISNGRLVADAPVADLAREAMATRSFTIEAKGAGIKKALGGMADVGSVTQNPASGRLESFTLTSKSGDDLRPAVFRLAVDSDWELYELREERASLEEVFRSLTGEQD